MEFRNFDGLAALHHGQMREALLVAAGVVFDGGIVFDNAADDFEEADAAGEGVGHGLEDHQRERLAVGDFAVGHGSGVGAGGVDGWGADGDGSALNGRGDVGLDEVEQVVEGHVAEAAAEEHGEDAVFADGLMQRGDQVLPGERAGVEVLLHQLVFAFRYELDQRLVAGLGVGGEAGGNLSGDLAAAVAAGGVIEGLHGDQIDDAAKALCAGDGNLDGHAVAAPAVNQFVKQRAQAAAAAGLGVVHLIDDDDTGNAGLVGVTPDALADRLDAMLGVDHNDSRFNGQQRRAGLVGEHMEAGSIDEIDFDALPLDKGDGVLHGCAAGDFFLVIGGNGRAIFHTALGGGHLGGMQQSGDQGGLATVRMPHYSYVADLTSLIRFHGVLLWFCWVLSEFADSGRGREAARTPVEACLWPD